MRKSELLKIAKPILFNTEMVGAILDGLKSETRRVIKPQPISKLCYCCMGYKHGTWGYPSKDAFKYWDDASYKLPDNFPTSEIDKRWNPKYHTNDILYVRETFAQPAKNIFWYKADFQVQNILWKPSIHMPKEAARIFLKVTNVRVERLQDISASSCIAEGVEIEALNEMGEDFAKGIFSDIWDSTLKKSDLDKYGWDANPWVWVYEFERIDVNDKS